MSTKSTKIVMGLVALAHNPSVALFIDGKLVSAIEEEKLNRQKDTTAFPHKAIEYVLKANNIKFQDIDTIAYYWDDRGNVLQSVVGPFIETSFRKKECFKIASRRIKALHAPNILKKELIQYCDGDIKKMPKIVCVDHHIAHAMTGIYSSPFDVDSALIIDGRGESRSTTLYKVIKNEFVYELKILESYLFPNSLGILYGAITQVFDEKPLSDEYKIMGLASYGKYDEKYAELFSKLIKVDKDYSYKLNYKYFNIANTDNPNLQWLSKLGTDLFKDNYKKDGEFTDEAKNLAFSLQNTIEVIVENMLRTMVKKYQLRNIVLSGGVIMNASLVGHLRRKKVVENIHIPLAPLDSGASIGAAIYVQQTNLENKFDKNSLSSPYQGPSYNDDEIKRLLDQSLVQYEYVKNIEEIIAKELANGKVVGWFSGKLEFGARALGSRSILGDPRIEGIRDKINSAVKRRELYRPFAPSVLEEYASQYFYTTKSRLMGEIVKVTDKAVKDVPAIVHINRTARPQTVDENCKNHSFRKLIEKFYEMTGIPMIINTSFNVKGEPIVCSPEDALKCFFTSGIEVLAIGNFIIRKRGIRNE